MCARYNTWELLWLSEYRGLFLVRVCAVFVTKEEGDPTVVVLVACLAVWHVTKEEGDPTVVPR